MTTQPNRFSQFSTEGIVELYFGLPTPLAILVSSLSKFNTRRHVFGPVKEADIKATRWTFTAWKRNCRVPISHKHVGSAAAYFWILANHCRKQPNGHAKSEHHFADAKAKIISSARMRHHEPLADWGAATATCAAAVSKDPVVIV